ncbi:hypothetical protein HDV05_004701 [Chytridiales sp. JEL 0842]|nr:hypothetical protein HDV05_004701 [Chytridiales sp. JEL 0842]
MDSTITVSVVKVIAQDLGDTFLVPWIFSCYLLMTSSFALIYGKMADTFGTKSSLLVALTFFTLGSTICGAAPTMPIFIAGRTVAGIGGGGLLTLVLIIVTDLVKFADRGKYHGIMGAFLSLGAILGPIVGGALTDKSSWRWAFYLNIPLCTMTILVVAFCVPQPATRSSQTSSLVETLPTTLPEKLKRLDILGALLLVSTVCLFLIPLQLGGSLWPWTSAQTISSFAASFILLVSLIYVEVFVAVDPIINYRFFTSTPSNPRTRFDIPLLLSIAFMAGSILISCISLIAFYFQLLFNDSATQTGINTLPFVLAIVVFTILSGVVVSTTGRSRSCLLFGSAVSTLGLGLTTLLKIDSPKWHFIVYLTLIGIGVGSFIQTRIIAIQSAVPRSQVAFATSLSSFCYNLGGSIGVAIIGAVYNNSLNSRLSLLPTLSTLPTSSESNVIDILQLVAQLEKMQDGEGGTAISQIKDSFLASFRLAFAGMIGFGVCAVLFALLLSADVENQKREGGTMSGLKKQEEGGLEETRAVVVEVGEDLELSARRSESSTAKSSSLSTPKGGTRHKMPPKHRGAYNIGVLRVEMATVDTTPSSEMDDSTSTINEKKSSLVASVFYPTDSHDSINPALWVPCKKTLSKSFCDATPMPHFAAPLIRKGLKTSKSHATINSALLSIDSSADGIEPSGGVFPVILFSHGIGSNQSAHSSLLGHLVSRGFVAIAVEHQDGTALQTTEYNLTHPPFTPFHKIPPSDIESDQTFPLRASQLQTRLSDLSNALELARALNVDGAQRDVEGCEMVYTDKEMKGLKVEFSFGGMLHLENVFVMGHSFGGVTAIAALEDSRRFRGVVAGVSLDPWMFPLGMPSTQIQVPMLSIQSETFHWKPNLDKLKATFQTTTSHPLNSFHMVRRSNHPDVTDYPTIFSEKMYRMIQKTGKQGLSHQEIMGVYDTLIAKFLMKVLEDDEWRGLKRKLIPIHMDNFLEVGEADVLSGDEAWEELYRLAPADRKKPFC